MQRRLLKLLFRFLLSLFFILFSSKAFALDGSGTAGYCSMWSDSDTLGNSNIYQEVSTGNIGIKTTSPKATLEINRNTGAPDLVTGTILHLVGGDGEIGRALFDSYGGTTGGTAFPSFTFRRSRGTQASKTALLKDDLIGAMQWQGYNGSAYTSARVAFNAYTDEDWTSSAQGTYMSIRATPRGSTSNAEIFRVNGTGIGIGTGNITQKLVVNGSVMFLDAGNILSDHTLCIGNC